MQLVPASQSAYCADKVPSAGADLGLMATFGGVVLHGYALMMHKQAEVPSSADVAKKKVTYEFVVPFWCAQPTQRSHDVNMGLEVVTVHKPSDFAHCGDYQIAVLVNTKDLKEGDVLRYAADPKH